MEERSINRASAALFGAMVLLFTMAFLGLWFRRPDLYEWALQNLPVLVYIGVGILGLSWVVTAGLSLGRYWARAIAGVYVANFFLLDYFKAADMISRSMSYNDPVSALLLLRLFTVFQLLVAVWAIALFYLFFYPRAASGSSPSTLSVEVLNTK